MVVIGDGLFICGGFNEPNNIHLAAQEILTSCGWGETTSLPKTVGGQCIIKLNSTHIMSIGGYDGASYF